MLINHAALALSLLPNIGPIRLHRLLRAFGGEPQNILAASELALMRVEGIGPELVRRIKNWENEVNLDGELRLIEESGFSLVTFFDEEYPELLRSISDAPIVLTVWGKLQKNDRHALAVVGSRNATNYGLQTAKKFSFQVASAGLTIVSGLARGIDSAAHEAALAAGGRTIAVIGSGLGNIYPPENQSLAAKIADGNGAVISEFPVLWSANKTTFPQRNRIISGMSRALLVVEAPRRSGSLITADLAAEQGRNLYAVPGQIDRETSHGCNQLIRDGAQLVTEARDILEDFESFEFLEKSKKKTDNPLKSELFKDNPAPDQSHALLTKKQPMPAPQQAENQGLLVLPKMTKTEAALFAEIPGDPISIDELCEITKLSASSVMTTLLQLEIRGLIASSPGMKYQKPSPIISA